MKRTMASSSARLVRATSAVCRVAQGGRHALQQLVGGDLDVLGDVSVAGVAADLLAARHVEHTLDRGAHPGGHLLHRGPVLAEGVEG